MVQSISARRACTVSEGWARGELLVAVGGRGVNAGVEAGRHLTASGEEAQPGHKVLQAATSESRGMVHDERLDVLRGNRLENLRTVVVTEELEQAEGRAAVMAQRRGGETAHLPEELEIGTDEDFAGARIHNLQQVAVGQERGQGPHER